MTQFKTINLCVTVTALHLLGVLQATHAAQPTNWKLVWSDEFDGPTLDYSKWGVEVNAYGGGNNELQIYSDRLKNVRLEKGHLIIEAHKDGYAEAGTRRDYSSGRIRTKHRGDWRYGRIDVRAKLPVGKGIWPAIWMLPTDDAYGTWAASGEIDIMELVGHEPSTYHGTLHYGGKWPKNKHTGKSYKLSSGTFADDFHIFSIVWEEGQVRWGIDGKLWQTQDKWNSEGGKFPAPFDKRFHLLINLAVGGNWPGAPDANTKFPAQFLVDYVRVYQFVK